MVLIIWGIFLFVIIVWIFLIFTYSKKTWLNKDKKAFFTKKLKSVRVWHSPKEMIIEYDKLFHKILQWMWYEWTFWEILKQKPSEIRDINNIWELHKLRNKLVHDFDLLSDGVLRKKSQNYEKEINVLLR